MTITSRPAGSVSEQGAPPSVGSSMPPELACEMARAGELLDLGDRVGARRIVRRVLDRAALELLAELAGLATDLGLGAEDLGAAAVRRALRWVPPTRVRRRLIPASGLCRLRGPAQHLAAGHAVRAARPGGVATGAARCRPTWPPAGCRRRRGAGRAARRLPRRLRPRRLERPQAVVCTGCHLERTPADVARGDGVCADCRADGLGRHPMVVRCEAILAAAVRRGPWSDTRELRRLWNASDAADRATVTAWVAAHDARIPPARRDR